MATGSKAAEQKNDTKEESGDSMHFPLFFKRPEALQLQRHGKAGIVPSQDFGFAAKTNSIIVNAIELVEAAKYYPIVFTQGSSPLPTVILGLEQQNYFVDAKGKWTDHTYVPAYVRKYPFIFMDVPKGDQFLLCVDEEAPQYKKSGGKGSFPLYDGESPSKLALNALEFCTAYHNHHLVTRQFCKDLKEMGLLMPSYSQATLPNKREIKLGGFQVIDEKKLNQLPDEKVLELHKKGWLQLIYFTLMSASHWKKLADMAGKKEKK